MTTLKILIVGGGCAGPALAFWLSKCGHRVVVVERSPALRDGGAQIDLRSQGIEAVRRMGLLETIRTKLVDEAGTAIVDENEKIQGLMLANKSGQGAQSLTSEYEIMRGDLVKILHDATKDKVEYRFGKTVEILQQDDQEATAHFSDGKSESFDLVVGADGQGSTTRKSMVLQSGEDPYKRLDLQMAYWVVPREEGDSNICKVYFSPGGRMITRRSHSATETQASFVVKEGRTDLSRATRKEQEDFWEQRFHDAGWQAPRFIEGMKKAENFFCHEAVQVKIDSWSKGRVVLLGDAAYCPSPFSGMGTTGSFCGAYVLAGEINRHSDNLPKAFSEYEEKMRPLIDDIQKISVRMIHLAIPDTKLGITFGQWVIWLVCLFRIPQLLSMFIGESQGGWKLPDYPEMYG